MRKNDLEKNKKHLLGIGLDNTDNHKRITCADQFSLIGGSEETHDAMTETVMKTMEDLKRKGKTLDTARPEELSDLLKKNKPV